MLLSLEYSVTFPTGRSLANKLSFEKGFGAITGPNEVGKSFIVEVIRFCLFGTAALRGTSDDYKKLKAKLTFEVRGEEYVVERTISTARLSAKGEELAVGVRPVNAKILSILGFNLDVFDVACVANQGDIEKLGSMKPTERKRMVDSVIGLGLIDELARWAGEEALSLTKEAEAIDRVSVEPTEPEKPADYVRSLDLETEIKAKQAAKATLDQVKGRLAVKREPPMKPAMKVNLPASAIREFAEDQRAKRARRTVLEQQLTEASPLSPAELEAVKDQVEAWQAWQEHQAWLRRNPRPQYTEYQLTSWLADLNLIEMIDRLKALEAKRQQLLDQGHICCPKCQHEWPVVEKELKELGEPVDIPPRPALPPLLASSIKAELKYLETWQEPVPVAQVENPGITLSQIAKWEAAPDRARLEAEIAALEHKGPDYEKMLEERVRYEDAVRRYLEEQKQYHDWLAEQQKLVLQQRELEMEVAPLPALLAQYARCRDYERDRSRYETDHDRWTETQAEVGRLKAEAAEWKKAKAAMATLRGLVKQHLVPSLNRVASSLIAKMTGGERTEIVVDEEFDIQVDGQPISTLSGSGKAVANLALRLGLGQVLTNNVFSVFIGDEIDASMDQNRAENTANTLLKMKLFLSQILLVSHKYPDADYHIALGQGNESH